MRGFAQNLAEIRDLAQLHASSPSKGELASRRLQKALQTPSPRRPPRRVACGKLPGLETHAGKLPEPRHAVPRGRGRGDDATRLWVVE